MRVTATCRATIGRARCRGNPAQRSTKRAGARSAVATIEKPGLIAKRVEADGVPLTVIPGRGRHWDEQRVQMHWQHTFSRDCLFSIILRARQARRGAADCRQRARIARAGDDRGLRSRMRSPHEKGGTHRSGWGPLRAYVKITMTPTRSPITTITMTISFTTRDREARLDGSLSDPRP